MSQDECSSQTAVVAQAVESVTIDQIDAAQKVIGKEERSPAAAPLNVPTPSRGGRGATTGGDKAGKRNASALEDLMRRRGVDEAWNTLEEMQQRGSTTDKYTVSRMLMKTVGDGRTRLNPSRIYRVISLVEKFIEMQPNDVDEVLFNALLDTCCRLKDLNRMEVIMQRMRELKITPSPVTLGILVKTYGQAGNIDKVLQVWDEMEKQRGLANAVTYGCMIDACVKCNRLDKAKEIFAGMRETGKHRNTIIYTTLIKGYGLEKDLASALMLFREMPQEGVPHNTITYNSVMDACVKSGDLATADALLHEITSPSSPLEPDLITFSTLLKGYCHVGDLDKALQIVEALTARGLRCDELVYNTLMDGCVKANDVETGVGLFEEMVQSGMRPSAITHSILARLYQKAGYEEDASDAVGQLYQHHGIERPTWGDRTRGSGRGKGNHRSPLSSPIGSPTSGYGVGQDQSWNMWGDARSASGYDSYSAAQSCASTPCGSPQHSFGNGGGGIFLPMDAMRGVPPPLPGAASDNTPYSYASSCAGLTPMNSAFQGSLASSPCGSPMGMDHQNQAVGTMMAVPASPAQTQSYGNGCVATMPGAGVPAVPPFPFSGTMPGNQMGAGTAQCFATQGNTPGIDAQAPQFFPAQAVPAMAPAVGNAMFAPQGAQQGQFQMSMSQPNDLVQGMHPGQQHSQPAFFQNFATDGQQVNAQAPCMGHPSPFCL